MKKTGLAVLGMVVAVFVAGCGSTGTVSPTPTSTPTSQATSTNDSKSSIDPKTVDYSKVDYIIAFGDSLNDLSMLQAAGRGVLMRNGREDLRSLCDDICGTNQEDGVAAYLADCFGEVFA